MLFVGTRGNDGTRAKRVDFINAMIDPSASFGGLFVPAIISKINNYFIEQHINSSYQNLAIDLISKFGIDTNDGLFQNALKTYDNFDNKNIVAPVQKIDDNLFALELYHGPTRAFKDMALQPFGDLLSNIALKNNKKYLITVATSGDTGPATIEAFANKKNIKIVCLYPKNGTSDVQRLQMVNTQAKNVKVLGINGSFDDAQNLVKENLKNDDFKAILAKENIQLSAANSVNFARILFQIIYNFHTYMQLVRNKHIKNGDTIDLTIPSGNFGNALGAYYAKKMGLNIGTIHITSNANNVLTSLINDGKYDLRNRELISTNSPAMDILKSSNVERLLYHSFGHQRNKQLMDSLDENNYFELTKDEVTILQKDFKAYSCDDYYCKSQINKYFNKGYLLDTHTATCLKAYEPANENINVIYSTAQWCKFSTTIVNALEVNNQIDNDLDAIAKLESKYNLKLDKNIQNVLDKKSTQTTIVNIDEVSKYIFDFIKEE